jgi:hypothetical protein
MGIKNLIKTTALLGALTTLQATPSVTCALLDYGMGVKALIMYYEDGTVRWVDNSFFIPDMFNVTWQRGLKECNDAAKMSDIEDGWDELVPETGGLP